MELRYLNKELERQCTELRYMKRKLDEQRAKALRLRLNELRAAADMSDLLFVGGKWEPLTGDRSGQWSARLTKNWRLIVEPEGDDVIVWIIEIVDYHKR